MRSFVKIDQDASIYRRYAEINTGLDEILEIGKKVKQLDTSTMYASASVRGLVSFTLPSVSYITGSEIYLNLYLANAERVNRYQTLNVHLISSSWVEGSGYFYQDVKNNSDGSSWTMASKIMSWSNVGGDYLPESASYTFSTVPADPNVKINITSLLQPVISGTLQNYGLMVKFPDADELDHTNVGNIKFFSSNTHTVFYPTVEVAWNDQTFITGSLKPIPNNNLAVVPRTMRQSYFPGEVDKIYLIVRDLYPDKRFDATQRYRNMYYLPSESYFRIRDVVSGVEVFKFDQYSAINCDRTGSYFVLDTSGLQLNRYYALDLKVKNSQYTFFPEFNYTFKIENDN